MKFYPVIAVEKVSSNINTRIAWNETIRIMNDVYCIFVNVTEYWNFRKVMHITVKFRLIIVMYWCKISLWRFFIYSDDGFHVKMIWRNDLFFIELLHFSFFNSISAKISNSCNVVQNTWFLFIISKICLLYLC